MLLKILSITLSLIWICNPILANKYTFEMLSRNQQVNHFTIIHPPSVKLSGLITIEGIFSNYNQTLSRFGDNRAFNVICIPRSNLYVFTQLSEWVYTHTALAFRCSCGYGAQNDEGNFRQFPRPVDEATILIANPEKSAFFSTIGISYIPFGLYQRNMIPATITQLLSQTQAATILTGFTFGNGFSSAFYLFKNPSNKSAHIENGGISLSYTIKYRYGYLSIIGDWLYNMSNTINYIVKNKYYSSKHANGYSFTVESTYNSFDATLQFVTSSKSFDVRKLNDNTIVFAKPAGLTFDIGFNHSFFARKARLGISFQRSWESTYIGLAGLPQSRIHGSWQYEIWKYIKLGFHGVFDYDYSKKSAGTGRHSVTGLIMVNAFIA